MPSDVPDFCTRERCVSCSCVALGSHQHSAGPFHCSKCWGDDAKDAPVAVSNWWEADDAARAWVEQAATLPACGMLITTGLGEHGFRVVVDSTRQFFHGVGAEKVWPAVQRMCSYLDDRVAAGVTPGVAVELGAGSGVPGMRLAQHGWRVHLTDVPTLLPLIHLNVKANQSSFGAACCPTVAALRWGCRADAGNVPGRPKLCLGSDITYFDDDFEPLLQTLHELRAAETVLAIQNRNACHERFAAAARAAGWHVEPATCRVHSCI